MSTAKLEFDVEMTCQSCVNSVERALRNLDVKKVEIDLNNQQVVVETSLPYSEILRHIEQTGRRAVLKGYGSISGGAAVAEIFGKNGIMGIVRFAHINDRSCIIDGTVDGLKGEHGLHICEFGDLTNDCENVGGHYNPSNKMHGSPEDNERHYGDLGNIRADKNGRAVFRKEDSTVKVWEIIGRSLVITEHKDDLGRGDNERSKIDGNSGQKLACGIIARSAGLFQNPKRICLCDGVSVWDEREKPVAGESRAKY
ncbi:copper chaperone for superoxide dismutase [Centruroides vittatus]|uniref:copper chaperone for superoxide dismutase n=1 Tax=Centruroides vittatus TaxID=120091 RepID=UPI003510B416